MAKVFRFFGVPGTLSMSSPLTIEFCNFHPQSSTVMGKVACLFAWCISGSPHSFAILCLSLFEFIYLTNKHSQLCRLIVFLSRWSSQLFQSHISHHLYFFSFTMLFLISYRTLLARIWWVLRSCMLCHACLASSIDQCSLNLLNSEPESSFFSLFPSVIWNWICPIWGQHLMVSKPFCVCLWIVSGVLDFWV